MAVLPVGTLNHFAKELGIPLELEAAVEIALTGAIRAIDVAEVNGGSSSTTPAWGSIRRSYSRASAAAGGVGASGWRWPGPA
jgi:diacylglycerol kinase family enzyme